MNNTEANLVLRMLGNVDLSGEGNAILAARELLEAEKSVYRATQLASELESFKAQSLDRLKEINQMQADLINAKDRESSNEQCMRDQQKELDERERKEQQLNQEIEELRRQLELSNTAALPNTKRKR